MEQDSNHPPRDLAVPADVVPATQETPEFDLDDYTWYPVRKRPRNDGWSHDRQRLFIEALADCGSVTQAAQSIGMSTSSAYRLRRSPGGEAFAAAWDVATHHAAAHLIDIAFDRAINGSDEPVFDREGQVVGRRMRTNDRLLMFLLRAHFPHRFAHARRDHPPSVAPAPPPPMPLAQAVAALAPLPPDAPHRLMPPDELLTALECADILDGELPPRIRDRDGRADADQEVANSAAFEARLDEAKRATDSYKRWRRRRDDDPSLA
jgi:hypothetical protein